MVTRYRFIPYWDDDMAEDPKGSYVSWDSWKETRIELLTMKLHQDTISFEETEELKELKEV